MVDVLPELRNIININARVVSRSHLHLRPVRGGWRLNVGDDFLRPWARLNRAFRLHTAMVWFMFVVANYNDSMRGEP